MIQEQERGGRSRSKGEEGEDPSFVEELSPENLQFLHQFSVSIFLHMFSLSPTSQFRNLFSKTRLPLRSLALLVNHRSPCQTEGGGGLKLDRRSNISWKGWVDCICPVDSNHRSRDNEASRASLFRKIVCLFGMFDYCFKS